MYKIITALLFVIISFSAPYSFAETPVPSAHPVKETQAQIKAKEAEKKKLQQNLKEIKSDLSSKKKQLVSVATDIKKNEQKLVNLENRIEEKQQEQEQIEEKLIEDKKSISDLVLALQRIKRIPPEAVISRPESPLKTAQSTMLLQSILPRVYKRADQLKADLERLNTLIESLEKDRNEALALSEKLKDNQKKLSSLLSQRETIYAKTEQDIKKQTAELTKISLQARNLKDLVRRIEEKQRIENKRLKEQSRTNRQTTIPKNTPIPAAGDAQLPVSGTMEVSYGKIDDIGAVSQGITIRSLPNALIVAPMGGVVDYAGQFKGYGQIIILKHAKGYHSLIAGLGKIDTVVGRAVAAGEPIGKMANSRNGRPLYYELRYKGQPVNPSKKIPGLK